jgi:CDP-glucose 4,6-dehydratase
VFYDFFKGRSVLVTGHTGFKGSWLALWLHKLGAQVTGLALPVNTEPSHFELIGLNKLINHIEGDIRDLKTVKKAFDHARPETVFHLAAQSLVRDSYNDPKTTFDINIGGTVNVLEAIRHCPTVKAAVVITSDKCYENKEWIWGYRENDPMGGHDPYSASKGAVEIICQAYLRSYFKESGQGPQIGFATARTGNVIGGGDWAKDRIIPDCVRALSKGEPIVVRNPQATRPWQHVLDPLCAYLLLSQRLLEEPIRFSGSWNFGPLEHQQIKVIELAEKFIAAWGRGKIKIPRKSVRISHEAGLLRLCIDQAVQKLNWKPVLTSTEAIDWTVEWYKAWEGGKNDLQDLSIKQINRFLKNR